MSWETVFFRAVFVLVLVGISFHLRPFHWSGISSAILGAGLGIAIVAFEMRLERASLKRLIGGAAGSILGILGALMISHLIGVTSIDKPALSFIQLLILLLM